MTVCLRPHHLLCLLTYAGKGYSPAFNANLEAIIRRIGDGEDILIVAGPDDICAPLLCDPDSHCRGNSVDARDNLAGRDLGEMLGISLCEGQRVVLGEAELEGMREAFRAGHVRAACLGCEWYDLCTAIAKDGFRHASLAPSR